MANVCSGKFGKKIPINLYELILCSQIKVNEAINSMPYFKIKNFYFVEKTQKNDVIIYFDSSGKAIHFGVMDTSTKMISKPGCLAKSIFIHDIDAYENLYGKDVKFMRRD